MTGWDSCGASGCDNEFVVPDPPAGYWQQPEHGSTVFCSDTCCDNTSEAAQERLYEQFHGGASWP